MVTLYGACLRNVPVVPVVEWVAVEVEVLPTFHMSMLYLLFLYPCVLVACLLGVFGLGLRVLLWAADAELRPASASCSCDDAVLRVCLLKAACVTSLAQNVFWSRKGWLVSTAARSAIVAWFFFGHSLFLGSTSFWRCRRTCGPETQLTSGGVIFVVAHDAITR